MSNKSRILSLDVLRGVFTSLRVFTSNPGSWTHRFAIFTYTGWVGCSFTDVFFPLFIFVVGVSVYVSLKSAKEIKQPSELYSKIFSRTIKLFLIGMALNLLPDFDFASLRVMGVLQRIAVVYCACALLFLHTNLRTQILLVLFLLIGYWAALTFIPVPGFGVASYVPQESLAAWLDQLVLGGHIYKYSPTVDPEGILSTLPAIATALTGMIASQFLLSARSDTRKLTTLVLSGIALIMLGLLWNNSFPIEKRLWTSSYVLFTSGIALCCLSFFYLLLDVLKIRKWSPVIVAYGTNALPIYIALEAIPTLLYLIQVKTNTGEMMRLQDWIFTNWFNNWACSSELASLLYSVALLLVFSIPVWILYKKNIIIKV
ncbi:MAG: DUF5009 domain-containing protein [Chitinophagales bacterium]|nr:DUF5009 domain-containing protein [Chitinophagales bacterium]